MNLTDPIFTNAHKARGYLEAQRWRDGVKKRTTLRHAAARKCRADFPK